MSSSSFVSESPAKRRRRLCCLLLLLLKLFSMSGDTLGRIVELFLLKAGDVNLVTSKRVSLEDVEVCDSEMPQSDPRMFFTVELCCSFCSS